MKLSRLILISGMGGSGRTTALHTLEDLGFYCMDNMPLFMLRDFLGHLGPHLEIERVAVGIDIRDRLFWDQIPGAIEALRNDGYTLELLYLDARDDVLMRRYKETRRIHPLDRDGNVAAAIAHERTLLASLTPYITMRLDTSEMTPHQLRAWMTSHYEMTASKMRISFVSFGYKHGILSDADLVLDVRFLKNPYFVPELSKLTGLDKAVRDYVFSDPDAGEFLRKTSDLIRFLVPRYAREGKHYLTVGIGCTGGQHRSVTLACALYEALKTDENYIWSCSHRDTKEA